MPQLLTKPVQKGKKPRGSSAGGVVKVATSKNGQPKRGGQAIMMPAKGKSAPQRRNRRSPVEILQELKNQREHLHEAMMVRLTRLDERISKLESRHSSKIKVTELLQTHSTEELQNALEGVRKQRSLLRRALKDRLTT